MNVLRAVREAIRATPLPEPPITVVVGVSGGVDSLCLLHALKRLRAELDWSLHVAHLNHRLRGNKADEDMVFVALQALEWKLPCTLAVVDVSALAQRQQLSLEEAARQARYGFLADVAQETGAAVVAVGHNADDQSETVLMHLLRGTGLAGLRGMSQVTDLNSLQRACSSASSSREVQLIRPLLTVPRAEIERYSREQSLTHRFDRSNLDTTLFRNRLRHELLPTLETYNPNIKALLRRTASVVAADYELVATMRDAAWQELIIEEKGALIIFDLKGWRALPLALRRATLRQAAYRLRPRLRDVSFVHVEEAVDVAMRGATGAQATLPQGLLLEVGYETLRLLDSEVAPSPPDWPLLWQEEPLPVAVPGQTKLPHSAWRLRVWPYQGQPERVFSNSDRWSAYLDAERLGPNPALRPRRPGDRFQPLGMEGQHVQVADFMVNLKIPARWRDRVPLLVHRPPNTDQEREIAWLVGWHIDERVKITARTARIIGLHFEK